MKLVNGWLITRAYRIHQANSNTVTMTKRDVDDLACAYAVVHLRKPCTCYNLIS
ncbi:hypothetical protein [Anabaena azotica]|uniref:Uncharacterized protein n=1 Tax=Anabaena azotica FACHB-119 TaxID=947527 RepID=A0ABR8DBW4_9NOST|nr:hypothetical protein [Anabaena azotica]MBD2504692.1 hypothetical protein [Anabaena azotica FACHB-119]